MEYPHARNSQTCTANLLTWSSEVPLPPSSSANATRSRHPNDRMSKVLFGGQITDEEAQSLYKRKPCSGYKLKEISGSNIFSAGGENGASEPGTVNGNVNNRTSVRIVQQGANGKSQVSFGAEEKISQKTPTTETEKISQKTPTTETEVAKQPELSGTKENEPVGKVKKQLSDAKSKELSGSNIFGPPLEAPPRSLPAAQSLEPKESKVMDEPPKRTVRTSVKISNPAGGQSNISFGGEPVVKPVKPVKKIHNQKFAELTGNDIFKGDTDTPSGSSEKPLSSAKLREMSGSGIFSDGKVESRDYFRGVRKPPGGESSISLG